MACRLYIEPSELRQGLIEISGEDHHYLFRVRRLRPNARVELFDGSGRQAAATVISIKASRATLEAEEPMIVERAQPPRVTVLQSLIKGERMEWCLQKLVELGADEIVPVQTARCVVKVAAARSDSRRKRHELVARDAARQCGSAIVPNVQSAMSLADALEHVADARLKLVFWEQSRSCGLKDVLGQAMPESVAVLVGPEGGFEAAEVEAAEQAGFQAVGLGRRILRAETASMAALAALSYAYRS